MAPAPPPEASDAATRPSDTSSLKPGDTLSGKYKVERLLGEGGMGEVFVAEDTDLGRRVALKVLRGLGAAGQAAAEERLRREARVLAAIGHPNIVQIFDIGRTTTGAPFLVMELLEGETLFARSQHQGQMPVKHAVTIVAEVLSALQVVHAKGMVHRDMKPENVFLAKDATGRETTKLLDLGIAKARQPEANTPALTETGAIVGTPYYMAPEQAFGVPDIDGRADLYAVGGILYTLLAGRTPFRSANVIALLRMIVDSDPEPVEKHRPDVPPELSAVIRRAMERERDKRYADATEFLEALAPFATLILTRPSAVGRERPSHKGLLYGLLAGVALAMGAILVLSGGGDESPAPFTSDSEPGGSAAGQAPAESPVEPPPIVDTPPPAPRTVFLSVDVVPPEAAVTLDGRARENGGFAVEPSKTPRTLAASLEGFRTQERQVIVQGNERIEVLLEPERRGPGGKRGAGHGVKGTYGGNLGLSKDPYGR
jgi:serine/threonine-protein kinase